MQRFPYIRDAAPLTTFRGGFTNGTAACFVENVRVTVTTIPTVKEDGNPGDEKVPLRCHPEHRRTPPPAPQVGVTYGLARPSLV